jgi:hypothetical protein
MANRVETRRTRWIKCVDAPWYPSLSHGGYVAYRIWQQFDGLRWFQRHEWECADCSTEMEEWIDGARSWATGAVPVSSDHQMGEAA